MENEHIPNVEIIYWEHTCQDGCCYDYGYKLLIDGKVIVDNIEVISYSQFVSLILTHFGIKHNIDG